MTCLLVAANLAVSWGAWPHLLVNALFLLMFGARAEERFGHVRFVVVYLLCGFLAAYGVALVSRSEPQLATGAVGAVSGVLGAYLALSPRARAGSLGRALRFLPSRWPAWPALILWFALQWFLGDVRPAALGFLVGLFAAVPMLRRRPRYSHPRRRRWPRTARGAT